MVAERDAKCHELSTPEIRIEVSRLLIKEGSLFFNAACQFVSFYFWPPVTCRQEIKNSPGLRSAMIFKRDHLFSMKFR